MERPSRPHRDRRRDARAAAHVHDGALPRADPPFARERRQRPVPRPGRRRPQGAGVPALHAHLRLGHLPDADAAAGAAGAAASPRDIVRSLVEGASESGSPAKWELGGTETGIMVGDPAPLLVAGAWAFGARRFDASRRLRGDVAHRLRAARRAVPLPEPRRAARRRPLGAVRRPARPRRLPPARLRPARPRRRVHPRPGVDDARVRARGLRARPLRDRRSGATRRGSRRGRRAGGASSTPPRATSSRAWRTARSRPASRTRRRTGSSRATPRSTRGSCRTTSPGWPRSWAATRRPGVGSTAFTAISTRAISRRMPGSGTSRASARHGSTTGSVLRGGRRRSCGAP